MQRKRWNDDDRRIAWVAVIILSGVFSLWAALAMAVAAVLDGIRRALFSDQKDYIQLRRAQKRRQSLSQVTGGQYR